MRLVLVFLLLAAASGCIRPHGAPAATPASAPVRVSFRDPDAAPPTFVRSTADSRTTRLLVVRDGLNRQSAFRLASDALAQKYSIDVSDPRAGFLMTTWQAVVTRDGVPDLRYRTRVVVRFLGDDWKELSIRSEANWQRGDEWDVGYDSALLDDATAAVRAKVGKKG